MARRLAGTKDVRFFKILPPEGDKREQADRGFSRRPTFLWLPALLEEEREKGRGEEKDRRDPLTQDVFVFCVARGKFWGRATLFADTFCVYVLGLVYIYILGIITGARVWRGRLLGCFEFNEIIQKLLLKLINRENFSYNVEKIQFRKIFSI